MSWDRVRRRHQLVHAVLDDIAATGKPEVPSGLAGEVVAEFGGFAEFLCDVQRRWYRSFDARLDALLEESSKDMRDAVVRTWHELAAAMPSARFLLDEHDGHPALAELDEHHRRVLHAATGVDLDLVRSARPSVRAPAAPWRWAWPPSVAPRRPPYGPFRRMSRRTSW
ncbi:hypothetical protein ACFSKW_29540 [Nonomuraea mangrovi]|uniref:Uncharacterized protein n=1 Tax=Nonomuraea mangrovi TaxID=2316207 RepID=A0ABW4T475_9ACTN